MQLLAEILLSTSWRSFVLSDGAYAIVCLDQKQASHYQNNECDHTGDECNSSPNWLHALEFTTEGGVNGTT